MTRTNPRPRRAAVPAKPMPMPQASPAAPLRERSAAELARLGRLDEQQVGGSHYRDMAVTPWQFLEAALTPDEMRGYLKAEVIVYLARERQKGGREDIRKAAHTLAKLLEVTAAES